MLKNHAIVVLVDEGYQDLQLWYPLLRLREEGVPVSVVSIEPGKTYFSELEYPLIPDFGIDEVQGRNFTVVIVPGGRSAQRLAEEPRMVAFVEQAADDGALLTSIAEGDTLLSAARRSAGISARTTDDLPQFCRALFEALRKQ
jgi:protease I